MNELVNRKIISVLIFSIIIAGGAYFGYEYYKNLKEQKAEKMEQINIKATQEEKTLKEGIIKSISVPGGINKSSYTSEDIKNMKNMSIPSNTGYQNVSDQETQKILESISVPQNK